LDAFEGVSIRQVSVGPGGYHTIALTIKNEVYTWGHNRVGQLGHINDPYNMARNNDGAFYLPRPRRIEPTDFNRDGVGPIANVVAGWGHTALLSDNGSVYTCGRNVQGQLGCDIIK
jgi:alpha-tubulin suppressor-like RCC1 family protein